MKGKNLKRAAQEDAARAHLLQDESSKKPKFDTRNPSTLAQDAPEEDAILDLDEIGKGGQSKRKAVRLEGYESDSSQENFDARADAKAKEKQRSKAEDEDANDMFADLEEDAADGDDDEDLAREGKKRKKEVRFMNQEEVQGQVSHSKSGGHVSADFRLNSDRSNRDKEAESSSDEGADDEERDRVGSDVDEELGAGSKKQHAPKLDAFNIRNEAEEGKFDANGNFIRNATDPFAVHDSWLEGASKADVKKAKEAHEKRENDRRRRDVEDDAVSMKSLLTTLIRNLEDGETILEGLARLGKGIRKSKQQPKWKKNRRKDDSAMDVDEQEDPEQTRRKKTIEDMTGAADHILTKGQTEIYDAERALLIRQYRRDTGDDWIDEAEDTSTDGQQGASKEWEYRWSDARDGGQAHGPFDARTMSAWVAAGYFGVGVEFREVGGGDGWSRVPDFS